MTPQDDSPKTWTDLAIGMYDQLTRRKAEIIYDFQNVEVLIPSGVAAQPATAPWRLNGTLAIRTRDLD